MENDPLNHLTPEARQRVEDALKALGGGVPPQNVFVHQSQYPGQMPDYGQIAQSFPGAFGAGSVQGMKQMYSSSKPREYKALNDAWAHWEYNPGEWARFDAVDWQPIRSKSLLILFLAPLLCLVMIGAILGTVWKMSQSIETVLAIGLAPAIILLTFLMFPMITAATSLRGAKKRYQARQNQMEPHRVTLSRSGVWEAGTYFPIHAGRLRLKSVKLTANPTVLHFKMLMRNGGGTSSGTTRNLHIPVPFGREAEAEQLRQNYYDDVINYGKINKHYQPPEPI